MVTVSCVNMINPASSYMYDSFLSQFQKVSATKDQICAWCIFILHHKHILKGLPDFTENSTICELQQCILFLTCGMQLLNVIW